MVMYRIDGAQVRDADSGEFKRELAGQPITIVSRDTTAPFPIYNEVGDQITGSVVRVMPTIEVPRIWINDVDAPASGLADLYLDWLDEGSGARGPVNFEAVLRAYAAASATRADDAADAAVGARVAAQDAASAAAQRGVPEGGLPGQVPVKSGPNDHEVGWGNFVRRMGEQPLRLWGVASSLPPAGSGQEPGDVIFVIGGGA